MDQTAFLDRLAGWLERWMQLIPGWFRSATYWERRYRRGGNSGVGSYGALADYKAAFLNAFIADNGILSVVDLGCGDGNQAALLSVQSYAGYDVSPVAVDLCSRRIAGRPNWSVAATPASPGGLPPADAAISLDVIYHLVEDQVYEAYMPLLFSAARQFVVIYSSDHDEIVAAPHIRHRNCSAWVRERAPDWRSVARVENPLSSDTFAFFQIFGRDDAREPARHVREGTRHG